MEISRLENLSGDIGITGVNWDRNYFQHSVVLIATAGLQLCVCFVDYRAKKNRMYQQETTIRQRVIQCELFYNQVAVSFCESFNVVIPAIFCILREPIFAIGPILICFSHWKLITRVLLRLLESKYRRTNVRK